MQIEEEFEISETVIPGSAIKDDLALTNAINKIVT